MSSDEEFRDEELEYDSEEESRLAEEQEAESGVPKTPGGEGEFVDDEGDFDDDGEADYKPSSKKKRRKEQKESKSSKRRKTSGKLINLRDLREIEAEASSDASEDENEAWAEELMGEDHLRFIAEDEEGEPGEETNYMKLN